MGVTVAQTLQTDKVGEQGATAGTKGTLKTDGKEYTLVFFADSESVTEAVNQFLQDINQQLRPQETLLKYQFLQITQEIIETEIEIDLLLKELIPPKPLSQTEKPLLPQHTMASQKTVPLRSDLSFKQGTQEATISPEKGNAHKAGSEVSYSSLFTLARTFNSTLFEKKQQQKNETKREEGQKRADESHQQGAQLVSTSMERLQQQSHKFEREREEKEGKKDQGSHQHQEQKKQHQQFHKKKAVGGINRINAARDNPSSESSSKNVSKEPPGSVDNIYIRFMALMARIIGQAEMEAHELYLKIKERTDNIDVLTLLVSKINSEKGAIDWSNNEEMKKLIEKARAIGVDIPAGKLTWSEDEKKLFKENIQMRKDSMEKITQLERTDMQRYLQEASQCHQARSNVLKLLKEVTDTIIANMRP